MPNLRIVADNVADDATIAASTTAGALTTSNLQTDVKSEVWRSTSTSATLTVTWATPQVIAFAGLAWANLTSTATIRVRGYANTADADPAVDSGTVKACAYTPLGSWRWGVEPLGVNGYRRGGVNTFSTGGGAYARAWLTATMCRKVTIEITDTDNPDGYIEAARLVIGSYWSPKYNAAYGAKPGIIDSSKHERSDAGTLRTDIGTRCRSLSVDLSMMPETDRAVLWSILRDNSLPTPIFFSLYPDGANPALEQANQLFCKLAQAGSMPHQFFNAFNTTLSLEEV